MTFVYPDGVPDIVALRDGFARFIEFKTAKGKLSKVQEYMHEQIRKQGFTVETLRPCQKILLSGYRPGITK